MDLVPTAVGALRFNESHASHRQLTETYGFDVTSWTGFAVLREVRELNWPAPD